MFRVDVDCNQLQGFKGMHSSEPSDSMFNLLLHALPRVGESLYVSLHSIPPECVSETFPPIVREGQYAPFVDFEVVSVGHRFYGGVHRPYIFCRIRDDLFSRSK